MYNLEWLKRQVDEAVNSTDTAFYLIANVKPEYKSELDIVSTLVHDALLALEDAQRRLGIMERENILTEVKNA